MEITILHAGSHQEFRGLTNGIGRVFDHSVITAKMEDRLGNQGDVTFKSKYIITDPSGIAAKVVSSVLNQSAVPDGVFEVRFKHSD